MARQIFRICGITNCTSNINIKSNGLSTSSVGLLKSHIPLVQNARNATFFTQKPATELWKSVSGLSNAGKKRGRGRGAPRKTDLNRGRILGVGKVNMAFPGLNTAITEGLKMFKQEKLPDNPNWQQELTEKRDNMRTFKHFKIPLSDRGWSGGIIVGRKLGPPDPIDEETFDGFQSQVIYLKQRIIMTSNMGRAKRLTSYVITGNGNGLVGLGTATANELKLCLSSAKNKAGQRLLYFPRYDNHTILHDFFTQFWRTKIFVRQLPKDSGLICHRAIKAICEAIGIKDMYAKVEGSKNVAYVIKAFLIGLIKQKTYQQMADEKKLHVVVFKKENDYFPTVIASPETVRKREEIPNNEITDFDQYIMNERIVLKKKKALPFYAKLDSYAIYLRRQERQRDQDKVRIRLRAEYGELRSFLTDEYPEARPYQRGDHEKNE